MVSESLRNPAPGDDLLLGLLLVLLGRLRAYFSIVEQSLRTEFLHKDETVKDWLRSFDWLEDSFFPIYQLFRRAKATREPYLVEMEGRVEYFKRELSDARKLLVDSTPSAVKKLFGLLQHVRNIHVGLGCWQDELRARSPRTVGDKASAVRPAERSAFPSALVPLRRLILEFRTQLISNEELEICITSRRIYLLIYYTAAVHPEEWTLDLHRLVVGLHEEALQRVPSGLARDSIRARLERLRMYNDQRFEELAISGIA